ncbi:hypothetical protein FHW79_005998 [Azospirillum sp. OGB3]|uniref:hypothetical protein n=1 Tax=Azospirillum sp. OGB3 TaxID=2587012 RepID=UPI001606A94B|nr:hypothetical protein [Azospirillum sp. OGB3]MBB3268323.1 hypothetical protein [Azospirillum sp. OGB3]
MASERWLLARFNRSDGTSKDWAIAVIGGELFVRFGTTGQAMQKKAIAKSSWKSSGAAAEGRRRLWEQSEQGYEVLGTCTFGTDGKATDLHSSPAAEIPVAEEATSGPTPMKDADIFFEITAVSWQRLFEVMEEAVERLSDHYECRWSTREGLPTGVPVIEGWTPAFDGHTGVGKVRHAGSLRRANGVAALLFLLTMRLLTSSDVTVNVVKADGGDIGKDLRKEAALLATFESSVDLITPAAEEAGLIPKRIRLSQIDTGQADYWF